MEQKQKEVTKSALRILRYNKIIEELNLEIERLQFYEKKGLLKVIQIMKKAINEETDWEKFESEFDTVHNTFFKYIQGKFPQLSRSEMKHLAYMKIGLSNQQIAKLMEVKVDSLRSLRYRIKKKLNLNNEIELRDYIESIENIEDTIGL